MLGELEFVISWSQYVLWMYWGACSRTRRRYRGETKSFLAFHGSEMKACI